MTHLQYMPGDPRLVDQLVCELKSKGIFDQFRKECIADVDTRPAYQNLRQRVESSVSSFLSRQCWKPDLNKNQLREKLRKHILDGNYLEQGVERIVDQVVNPKVASVFIPQVEDLVYNYLGITMKRTNKIGSETSAEKASDLLPTDLEAVSPGSVNEDKDESMEISEDHSNETKMVIDDENRTKDLVDKIEPGLDDNDKEHKVEVNKVLDIKLSIDLNSKDSDFVCIEENSIPLPQEDIKLESIPEPENSPPKPKVELGEIALPKDLDLSTDIPLPDEIPKTEKEAYFKPISVNDDCIDDDSSSDSSLRRNMSPLTPVRNFNTENSCDAQLGFDNDSGELKSNDKKEPSTFKFSLENKSESSREIVKTGNQSKKDIDQTTLSYQFQDQVTINTFATPLYDDSSDSNNLHIDYESDANSKLNNNETFKLADANTSQILNNDSKDVKKEQKTEEKKSSHKNSHSSRDSHRHSSSSKDRKSGSKSRDRKETKSSRDEPKKSSKDDYHKSKSSHREKSSKDGVERKESSKHKSSSHKTTSHKDTHKEYRDASKDTKSHKSSSQRHSSSKHSDERKPSSVSHKDRNEKSSTKEKGSEKSSKDRPKDSKSATHQPDKDKKSSKNKNEDKKKDKKDVDDHYSSSGRGNHSRRSTDRDSNDGSSSSKGSQNQPSSKASGSKRDSKNSGSKSDHNSTSSDSTSPSDKDSVNETIQNAKDLFQYKPVVRVDTHLETPIATPPRLAFVPDVTLKKPKIAANFEEAKKLMKMRKFLDEEQRRMNQEAALLLEFQANVRPSLSQVYSSIPGPELEFACISNTQSNVVYDDNVNSIVGDSTAIETEDRNGSKNSTDNDMNYVSPINNTEEYASETISDINLYIKATGKFATSYDDTDVEYAIEGEQQNPTYEEQNGNESDLVDIENPVDLESEIGSTEVSSDISSDGQKKHTELFEITIITEELSEDEASNKLVSDTELFFNRHPEEDDFKYFAEYEKYTADLESDRFNRFLKSYIENSAICNKMYLINCNTYEENVFRDVAKSLGHFDVVNYYKNGCLKLPQSSKNIVKDVNISSEIALPFENNGDFESFEKTYSSVFSPVKSEYSFDLSSDYDAKLEEMVNRTSRQQVMEIILGVLPDESPSKMPTFDYFTESNIETIDMNVKRKLSEDSSDNNNENVFKSNKLRRLSESDQITSTTEDTSEKISGRTAMNNSRSKFFCKARRVGLPRPKKCSLPNSPSSDKSVENYEQNSQSTPPPPNGKLKSPRNKVQRYDTSDLYKPKLHYLSRRNNIT